MALYGPHGMRLPRDLSKEIPWELYRLGKEKTIGDIFYVDCTSGLDTYDGFSRSSPLLTIAEAIDRCAAGHDDYIIVMSQLIKGATETFPVTMTKNRVHLLGVPSTPDANWIELDSTATGDVPAITFDNGVQACEIAGFSIAGGGPQSSHGAIELIASGNTGHYIHNCSFGHYQCNESQDGIRIAGNNWGNIIEENWFYGHNVLNGKLSRNGIHLYGGGNGDFTIRNNYFLGCDVAMYFYPGAGLVNAFVIDDNKIACGSDAIGVAIDLDKGDGCLITRNRANFGDTQMAQIPYRDTGAAGANHWFDNWYGILPIMPV